MAVVWGPKVGGTTGSLSEDEIIDYLYTLTSWRRGDAITKAFRNAANYMLNHDGKGGGTIHHFDGKRIYHATENRGEMTIFFTNKGGDVVSIVGVGEHSGPSSATATYTLVWKSASWKPTKMVSGRLTPTNQISL
ncbi:MAG TPA: hypothetical protein VL346_01720 [Acidobacteriaceae bacterium]|nr:hypothetical protein [Acidobacteriaceae bacterium]